jgi:hypothetical protein
MQLKLAELADFCLADIYDFAQAQGRVDEHRFRTGFSRCSGGDRCFRSLLVRT